MTRIEGKTDKTPGPVAAHSPAVRIGFNADILGPAPREEK
jgi:hypothetical protein